MLGLIHQSRTADLGRIYGWSTSFLDILGGYIAANQDNYASNFAKNGERIQKIIDESLTAMRKTWK